LSSAIICFVAFPRGCCFTFFCTSCCLSPRAFSFFRRPPRLAVACGARLSGRHVLSLGGARSGGAHLVLEPFELGRELPALLVHPRIGHAPRRHPCFTEV
jgi:hypothetical protein